jgi:hypothetical protein
VLCLLVLAIVVLVVSRRGGDEDGAELERGTPAFPLRGELAEDDGLLAEAADAWIADDREEEDERGDDHDEVFDGDERRVTALWAGKLGDTWTVVATHGDTAALLQKRGERNPVWQVSTVPTAGSAQAPAVLAFGSAVLLPDGVRATFVPATTKPLRVVDRDGLRMAPGSTGNSSFSDGVLLMPDGVGGNPYGDEPTAVVTGSAPRVRRLSSDLADRMQDGSFDVAAMRRFVAAASGPERSRPDERTTYAATKLTLVADEDLAGLGPTMVLSEDDTDRSRRVSAAAGAPADGTDEAEPIPLGPADDDLTGRRSRTGPGLAAAYVFRVERPKDDPLTTTDDDDEDLDVVTGPFLLVAGGPGVASIEVRVGTRRIVRRGPVAVIDASWASTGDPADRDVVDRDVSVLGTTAEGRVVVPATLPTGPAVVGED